MIAHPMDVHGGNVLIFQEGEDVHVALQDAALTVIQKYAPGLKFAMHTKHSADRIPVHYARMTKSIFILLLLIKKI